MTSKLFYDVCSPISPDILAYLLYAATQMSSNAKCKVYHSHHGQLVVVEDEEEELAY